MAPYQIDGEDLTPQPTQHDWSDYPRVAGNDARGAPIYLKYNTARLRCDLTVCYHDWFKWMDGAHHTVTMPSPGSTDDWVDYASVYCQVVEQGTVTGAHKDGAGMDSVEMELIGIEV